MVTQETARKYEVVEDLPGVGPSTADELMRMKANVLRLTTGSKSFDELIGGGLETQTITEVYGEYGVGKSILCHQLAVNVQLPIDKGGPDGKIRRTGSDGRCTENNLLRGIQLRSPSPSLGKSGSDNQGQ